MRGYRHHGRIALALIFTAQILISSLCISTAAQAMETVSLEHCHQSIEHSNMQHEMSSEAMHVDTQNMPMSACSHCSSPEDFSLFTSHIDLSPADFLLAIVEVGELASSTPLTLPAFVERTQAPPNSSSTLYTTTQRIRI